MSRHGKSLAFVLLFAAASRGWADPLDKIAKTLSQGAGSLVNKKVAVLPFPYHDGRDSQGSTIVSERLITKIVKRNKLEVIERSLIEKVLRELKLQATGAIDQDSAKELGKILGVEAIVSGTLIDLGEGQVEVNSRLIRTETGQIIVAASGELEKVWKDEPKTEENAAATAEPVVPPVPAPSQAPSETLVLSNLGPAPSGSARAVPPPYQAGEPSGGGPEFLSGPEDMILVESGVLPGEERGPLLEDVVNGFRMIRRGDAAKAEYNFKSVLARAQKPGRENDLARLGLSASYFAQGKEREAVRLAESVASETRYPRVRSVAHFLLGRYGEGSGKIAAAREHYLEVVRSSPFQTGMVLKAGNRLRALEYARRQGGFQPLQDGPKRKPVLKRRRR